MGGWKQGLDGTSSLGQDSEEGFPVAQGIAAIERAGMGFFPSEVPVKRMELRPAQYESKVSRKRDLDLFDSAPLAYLALGTNMIIMEANYRARRLLGPGESRLVGCSLSQFVLPEDQHIFHSHFVEVLNSPDAATTIVRLLRSDGTILHCQLVTVAAVDKCTTITGYQTIIWDITAHKQAEDELKALQRQLLDEQKDESLRRLAGMVAHHFNNLLCVVMGNLELALSDSAEVERVKDCISHAMGASRRAVEMSRLMLAYVGSASGRKRLVSLTETAREALLFVSGLFSKDVIIRADLAAEGAIVVAVEDHLKQVVINLLLNAYEALGNWKREISVSAGVFKAEDISGATLCRPLGWKPRAGSYAALSISDTGCGLDEMTLESIFDPFFTTKCVGRGLGLSVVLGLVRLYEGAIAVQSQPGRGATFRLFLPVAESYVFQAPRNDLFVGKPLP